MATMTTPAPPDAHYVEPMFVLSTGHVAPAERDLLPSVDRPHHTLPMRIIPHEYGALIHVSSDSFAADVHPRLAACAPTLATLLRFVHDRGGVWVNLDIDGALLGDELETFE